MTEEVNRHRVKTLTFDENSYAYISDSEVWEGDILLCEDDHPFYVLYEGGGVVQVPPGSKFNITKDYRIRRI